MSNIYTVLAKPPALEAGQMYMELEQLAQALVKSGRMRIDAEERQNFVRYPILSDGITLMLSERELHDPTLIPQTEQLLTHIFSRRQSTNTAQQKTKHEMERLRKETQKLQKVSAEVEIKLARVLVQSAEPIVTLLLLLEHTEVYISFSHNIGDMLDIPSWQANGANSGMQSSDGQQSAVFISCGGDPFADPKETQFQGDGFNAFARMMVIGGQELGHYADIMRNNRGRHYGRHSTNLSVTRAKDHVRTGRLLDIEQATQVEAKLRSCGLKKLAELERHLRFYHDHNGRLIAILITKIKIAIRKRLFMRKCFRARLRFVKRMPKSKEPGTRLAMAVADMKFNLAPKADVYSHPDPTVEEAIACVEALARVPQQVNKWGHAATRFLMPNLYRIYYTEVIPACVTSYEAMSGQKYRMKLTKAPWWKRLLA